MHVCPKPWFFFCLWRLYRDLQLATCIYMYILAVWRIIVSLPILSNHFCFVHSALKWHYSDKTNSPYDTKEIQNIYNQTLNISYCCCFFQKKFRFILCADFFTLCALIFCWLRKKSISQIYDSIDFIKTANKMKGI